MSVGGKLLRGEIKGVGILDENFYKDRPRWSDGFLGGSEDKNLSASEGDTGLIPGSGRSPGEEMATHSSILAWEIPWTKEPGGLYNPWGHKRVAQDLVI